MSENIKNNSSAKKIEYPYLPGDRIIEYVPADNKFMLMAKEFALENSLDKTMPTSSVIVLGEEVVGMGANGSDYHEKNGCERVKQSIPTGQSYDLCEGCHPKNHSELRAVKDALNNKNNIDGADLYLWGHWWCCEPCWKAMIDAGIKNVYLMEGSEILFNKNHPDNIVGKQFS